MVFEFYNHSENTPILNSQGNTNQIQYNNLNPHNNYLKLETSLKLKI